jgi:hypothetical protein
MVRFLLKCSPGIKNLTSAMCVSFLEGPIVLNSSVTVQIINVIRINKNKQGGKQVGKPRESLSSH